MAFVSFGEGFVWVDDPVSASSDPELPQPQPEPPLPTANVTTVSNNAASTGNGTSEPAEDRSTPAATSSNVNLDAQIRGEVAGIPQTQGALNIVLNRYTAAELAKAFPQFGTERDYQIAKDGLPKGLIVPGTIDAAGRPQFVAGTPEFINAEQIATARSREALRRAGIDNGLPPDSVITCSTGFGGKVFLTLTDLRTGKPRDVDITSYFEGLPKPPVAIDISVPTYGTSTTNIGGRDITVTKLPEVARTVSTSEGNIVVDANSETARFIQWQGSQPGIDGRPLRETWARQGISDPYSDPKIVGAAVKQIERSDNRTALYNQSGVAPPTSQIEPWNDPNWPKYQGSNKEAYETASAALTDPSVKNDLKAKNGWDEATFQNWALRSTNPEEWGRQAAARDARNGVVVGGGVASSLSSNGNTVVTTNGSVNTQGFANTTFSNVSARSNFNPSQDAAYLALFPANVSTGTPLAARSNFNPSQDAAYLALFPANASTGTSLVASTGLPFAAITDPAVASAQIARFNPSQAAIVAVPVAVLGLIGTAQKANTASTAQDAAKLLVQTPALTDDEDQNLQNIVGAQGEIERAEENIQNNNRQISDNEQAQAAAQEQQRQAQAIIDQNNLELADDNLPDSRRAELEANNAAQRASIAQNAAVIDQAQNNIDEATANNEQQTDSILTNQDVIDENSESFFANSSELGAPVDVDVDAAIAADQNFLDANSGPQAEVDPNDDPFEARRLELQREANEQEANRAAGDNVNTTTDPALPGGLSDDEILARRNAGGLSDEEILARQEAAAKQRAQEQATLQARYKQPASADWRVRLQLAPNADYLYKDRTGSTILAPLYDTDGVIFPYTPSIETTYNANYEMYDLTHSNYRGYFYKNSRVNDINMRATFTAQDTQEANYLLAVIHFFRSVTKMFYGAKDALRGAPPPLTYLSGLGQYQFNQHPCVISQFNYSLPNDVDYIRAGAPNNYGTNLLTQRARTGAIAPEAGNPTLARLLGTLTKPQVGAPATPPSPSMINQNVNNLAQATYVPTKIEISLTLLPINTRSQVSKQFNMKEFASGALIKGGFW